MYHGHSKCNRQKLAELPDLWAYARDRFLTPGFGDTIDFVHIKRHYDEVHRDARSATGRHRVCRHPRSAYRRPAPPDSAAGTVVAADAGGR